MSAFSFNLDLPIYFHSIYIYIHENLTIWDLVCADTNKAFYVPLALKFFNRRILKFDLIAPDQRFSSLDRSPLQTHYFVSGSMFVQMLGLNCLSCFRSMFEPNLLW